MIGSLCDVRTSAVCTTRTGYAIGVGTLAAPDRSQSMTQLSANLTVQRERLGLTVPQVHAALSRAGVTVAFSTVAGWFNGSRKVRDMEHLKALCVVLETDMNTLTGSSIAVVEGKVPVQIQRELDGMTPEQQEAILALVRTMKGTAK